MKAYGIEIHQGTVIKNSNIEYGSSFPQVGTETRGQLFFRIDENILYFRNHGNTIWIPLTWGGVWEYEQPSHGFSDADVGTPVYFDGITWTPGMAQPGVIPIAIISGIPDPDTIMVQEAGTVNDIHPSVNEDGGFLIPGTHYFSSRDNLGKFNSTQPGRDEITALTILAVAPRSALIINHAPIFPLFLHELADCYVPGPNLGDVLTYDPITGQWVGAPVASTRLPALFDVADDLYTGGSPIIGDRFVLAWDDISKQWIAVDPISISNTSVITDNADGTYTHDDGQGNVSTIDTNNALEDLTDVDIDGSPGPQTGDILVYDAGTGQWSTAPAMTFIDLTDTPANYTASAGDADKFLRINPTGNGVIFEVLDSTDLTDFPAATAGTHDGLFLVWNPTAGGVGVPGWSWSTVPPVQDFDDLGDVKLGLAPNPVPAPGDSIVYDPDGGGAGIPAWVNQPNTFLNLTDTDPTAYDATPGTGDIGKVVWVNAAGTGLDFHRIVLSDMDDVDYPAVPTQDQVLKWNDTSKAWEPVDDVAITIGTFLGTWDFTIAPPPNRGVGWANAPYVNGDYWLNSGANAGGDGETDAGWTGQAPVQTDTNDAFLTDGAGKWYFLASTIEPALFIRNDGVPSVTTNIPWSGHLITELGPAVSPESAITDPRHATNKAYVDARQFIQLPDTPGGAAGTWAGAGATAGAQFLRLDGTDGGAANNVIFDKLELNDIDNMPAALPIAGQDGQGLTWDDTNGWVYTDIGDNTFIGNTDTPAAYLAADRAKFVIVEDVAAPAQVVFHTLELNDIALMPAADPTATPTNVTLIWNGTDWDYGTPNLSDLADVPIPDPIAPGTDDGKSLVWNPVTDTWDLADLGDGTFIGLSDTPADYTTAPGAVPRVNAGQSALEWHTLILQDMTDVPDPVPANDGQGLVWNDTSPAGWTYSDLGDNTFIGNTDTPLAYAPIDSGMFVRVEVNAAPDEVVFATAALDDLSDVDLTTTAPTIGDFLGFDGTNWVPDQAAITFLELTDTPNGTTYPLSGAADRDIAVVDNTANAGAGAMVWSRITLEIPAGNAGDTLVYDPNANGPGSGEWVVQPPTLGGLDNVDPNADIITGAVGMPQQGDVIYYDAGASPPAWTYGNTTSALTYATLDEIVAGTVVDKVINPAIGTDGYLMKARLSTALTTDVPQTVANTVAFNENIALAGAKTFTIGGATNSVIQSVNTGIDHYTIKDAIIDGGTF